MARAIFREQRILVQLTAVGLWLAGHIEASGFEPVAFVLCAVLFAHVSAAVGAVLYCEYLAVCAYRSPNERHFLFHVSGSSRPISIGY